MTPEEITIKIKELNEKRMQAWKNSNYKYQMQLIELVEKLKGDLANLEK